jgi:phosphatidylserine/phosphatidylglycerophosphate/cardiolipin synthase-like enzyme
LFIPLIFFGIGFYFLNYAHNEPKKSIDPLALSPEPQIIIPIAKEREQKSKEGHFKNNHESKTIIEKRKKSVRLSPFFSPKDNIREKIIELIKEEKKNINCAAFRLTDPAITTALLEAQERGVKIHLIIDKEGLSSLHSKSLYLFMKGICIFVYPPITFDMTDHKQKREGLMHNKFICFESQETVITGSFNFTKSAQDINQENMLIVEDPEIYQTYNEHFAYLKTISSSLQNKEDIKSQIQSSKKSQKAKE